MVISNREMVFPGSKLALEAMTGRHYEPMYDVNRNLMRIDTRGLKKHRTTDPNDLEADLYWVAREIGADAVVHATYFFSCNPPYAQGYLVKESGSKL